MPTPPSARETSLCGEPPTDPFYLSRKSKSALVPGTYDNSPRGTLTLLPSPPYLRPSQQPHVNQPPPTAHTHCSIARDRTSGTRPFAIHPNFPPARALRPRAIPTPPPPPIPPLDRPPCHTPRQSSCHKTFQHSRRAQTSKSPKPPLSALDRPPTLLPSCPLGVNTPPRPLVYPGTHL